MLPGIDISYAQPKTPKLTGLSFVGVRATYGTEQDERWSQHSLAVRRSKLYLVAYAFGVGGAQASPVAQAQAFLRVAHGADILVLDQETNVLANHQIGPTMTDGEADLFCRTVQRAGRRIGLYHSRSGFPNQKAVHFNFRWIALWGSATPPSGLTWTFWQFGGTGLDRDWFNGDATALRNLAIASHVRGYGRRSP